MGQVRAERERVERKHGSTEKPEANESVGRDGAALYRGVHTEIGVARAAGSEASWVKRSNGNQSRTGTLMSEDCEGAHGDTS